MSDSEIEIVFSDEEEEELKEEDEEEFEDKEDLEEVEEFEDEDIGYELNLSITGARPGDVLIGRQKCTMEVKIRVYQKEIWPQKDHLDELRDYPKVWKSFIQKLSNLPFFAKMKFEEREKWLEEHQSNNEFIDGDCEMDLLDAGKQKDSKFCDLPQEDLDTLMKGKENETGHWTFDEVQSFFPRKAGSKAKHQTLVFIKGFWKVVSDYKVVNSHKGIIFDVQNGLLLTECKANEDQEIIKIQGIPKTLKEDKRRGWVKDKTQDIAFLISKDRYNLKIIDELIKEVYMKHKKYKKCKDQEEYIISLVSKIKQDFKDYSAGAFKSEMQKIIRFAAPEVSLFDGEIVDADLVLCVVVGMLAQNPGSFVPDIQRYVTGLESVGKRLAVICGIEDVYMPPERMNELVSLLSGALLAQRVRSWIPNKQTLINWMETALKSKYEERCAAYDWHEGLEIKPYCISNKISKMKVCSALIDELKTFESDLGMIRYVAEHYDNLELLSYGKNKGVMPISHGTDQHWATGFVYFFSSETIKKVFYGKKITAQHQLPDSKDASSFGKLFKKVFWEVCGVNPRRHDHLSNIFDENIFEDDEFVKEVRFAQKMYLLSKKFSKEKRKTIKDKTYEFDFKLNNSWLAGLVGAIEIKGNPATIVTMRPDDPYQLIAVRKPARGMAEFITAEREEQAKKTAKQMLKDGIKLNAATSPSDFLKGAVVKLEDDVYYIEKDGVRMTWDDARELHFSLPYHNTIEKSIENALNYIGDGIEKNAFEKLNKLLRGKTNDVIYRALSYISNYKSEFEMNRVGRDGHGTYQAVNLNDPEAYQMLLTISQIFPAALRPVEKNVQKFSVPIGPLLWNIVSYIKEYLSKEDIEDDGWDDIDIVDELERKPWTHQIDTVEEMARNFKSGTKGSLLWLPVGLGKTLIIMKYIAWLKNENKLPKYILYTLPSSAIESVVHEIQAFGVKINYIIPLKSIKGKVIPEGVTVTQKCELVPFVINIIRHDDMRKIDNELRAYASNCMFLVDEVHKALNETKRTSACLDIARLSKLFVVFTGTVVTDNKVYKLLWWLEQIVEFEVNMKNFWVSANSIVARKVVTGVKVNRKEIVAKFTDKELNHHKSLIPISMGGNNHYTTIHDYIDASKVCYKACSRKMITETMRLIDKGVMLVAQNKEHQEILKNMLLKEDVNDEDIYVLTGENSIFLTDEHVKKKKVHDYKVVIVPVNKPEGYTLTRLASTITSVYPSSCASRIQLFGRVNRIGQKAKEINEITVHCGLLSYILKNHDQAKSLMIALSDMAKKIDIKKV